MPTAEWEQPFTLTSPQGTLEFNQPTTSPYTSNAYYVFLLDQSKCKATPAPLRVTTDPIPQADGSIIQPGFKVGYQMTLGVEFWIATDVDGSGNDTPASRVPACDTDRRVMWDTLMLHLNSLVRPDTADLYTGQCRIKWVASGASDERMLDRMRLVEWPETTLDPTVLMTQFTLGSEFPYAVDVVEASAHIAGTVTITNPGSSEMFPVWKVYASGGSLATFTLTNYTYGEAIVYSSSLPGGLALSSSNYAEIDTFRNTVYRNGNQANLKASIDVVNSDFWSLRPGPNVIHWSGSAGSPYATLLWRAAWA